MNKKYSFTIMAIELSRLISTDIKLLRWKSVLYIGLSYLIAVGLTVILSGTIMLVGNTLDGTSNFEIFIRMILYAMAGSICISVGIGLLVKLFADAMSASYFLRKKTDIMFEKNEAV